LEFNARLRAIQMQINDNAELFQVMPDFDKWQDAELLKYIKKGLELFHKENAIMSYADAEKRLHYEFVQGLINEDEYKIMLEGEKSFWGVVSD